VGCDKACRSFSGYAAIWAAARAIAAWRQLQFVWSPYYLVRRGAIRFALEVGAAALLKLCDVFFQGKPCPTRIAGDHGISYSEPWK